MLTIPLPAPERPSALPAFFYRATEISVDARYEITVAGAAIDRGRIVSRLSDKPYDDVIAVDVVLRDSMYMHYFHFMETLLGIHALVQECFPNATVRRLLISVDAAASYSTPRQNNAHAAILSLLMPRTTLVLLRPGDKLTVKHALVLTRRHKATTINKFLEPYQGLVRKWFPRLQASVEAPLAERRPAGSRKRALYIRRTAPRTFSAADEATLLEMAAAAFDLQVIDFAQLNWLGQVNAARQADVMIGVHGNGLTNLLWLPSNAWVIEFFPEAAHHYDYQLLAEVSSHRYAGFSGDTVRHAFARGTKPFGFKGAVNQPVRLPSPDSIRPVLETAAAW